MSKYAIIVGGGRVGRRSAAGLTESGYVVTVIERDPEQCANFPSPQASRVVDSTVYPAALGAEAVIDRIVPSATGRPTAGR